MADPLVDGAIDNTLGQTAYGWFEENPLVDPDGRRAFIDYTNAYIYIPRRYVPLPEESRTDSKVVEPLISLWHKGAMEIKFAADHLSPVDREVLWRQFELSLEEDPEKWSRWLRFQWTPLIVAAFKSRVPKWPQRFTDALEEVRPAASEISGEAGSRSVKECVKLIEKAFPELGDPDREYKEFARNHHVPVPVLACAYGWDWFSRGGSYALRADGMTVRFHDLRDMAVVSPSDQRSQPVEIRQPVDWGNILAQSIDEGVIPRDPSRITAILEALGVTVQTDSEYRKLISLAETTPTAEVDQRELKFKSAIGVALDRAGEVPVFREETARRRLITALASAAAKKSSTAGTLAYELVDMGLNSKLSRRVQYKGAEIFGRKHLWKVFRIPGRA